MVVSGLIWPGTIRLRYAARRNGADWMEQAIVGLIVKRAAVKTALSE